MKKKKQPLDLNKSYACSEMSKIKAIFDKLKLQNFSEQKITWYSYEADCYVIFSNDGKLEFKSKNS